MHHDLLLRGGTCLLPWGTAETDIGIVAGRIATLSAGAGDTADQVVDCTHLHVLPGMIDAHVHLRDPFNGNWGDTRVESIPTGTRAAVLGGITCVFDMPNTSPAITDAASLARKQAYVEAGNAFCDVGLYVGATTGNAETLTTLERGLGVCATKVFAGSSTGDLLVADDASLARVMRHGTRRIAYHSEDEFRLQERRPTFAAGGPHRLHADWRDVECAFLGTRRIIALARGTGRPAHILHVSTAEELGFLRDCRDIATAEVLVNHLTQTDEAYDRLGAYAVMNPPIRDARHRDAAWRAVAEGVVDVVGSDHAPHSHAAKQAPWPQTAAGLTGVQTLLPVMLDHVNAGRLTLARLVDLMAAGPARVYGLVGKGRLVAGNDADITLVDMRAERRIENRWIASPCGWTPFDGMRVRGWPVATIVRGRVVMRDDAVLGEPAGRLCRFA